MLATMIAAACVVATEFLTALRSAHTLLDLILLELSYCAMYLLLSDERLLFFFGWAERGIH